MSKGKSIALGLLVGGAAGAVVSLLTTPSSGKELRSQIFAQVTEWKAMIDSIIEDGLTLKDQIAQTSKEGAALISELTEEMKTSVSEWKSAVEPSQDNIHTYLEEIEASIKDLEEKLNAKETPEN